MSSAVSVVGVQARPLDYLKTPGVFRSVVTSFSTRKHVFPLKAFPSSAFYNTLRPLGNSFDNMEKVKMAYVEG
jgi:hypothetical protein